MNRQEMLDYLTVLGEDNSTDYDDEQDGYFGWHVDGDRLVVNFVPTDEDGSADAITYTATWRLVPIADGGGVDRRDLVDRVRDAAYAVEDPDLTALLQNLALSLREADTADVAAIVRELLGGV